MKSTLKRLLLVLVVVMVFSTINAHAQVGNPAAGEEAARWLAEQMRIAAEQLAAAKAAAEVMAHTVWHVFFD